MSRAEIVFTETAERTLRELITTHQLPGDTKSRVQQSVQRLATFPRLGSPLAGEFDGLRFILGPWRWLIIVYRYRPEDEAIIVRELFDGRASNAPTANR